MIQHDMMLWDHGMPRPDGTVSPEQRPEARLQPHFEAAYVAFVRALRERLHPRGVRDVRTVAVEGGRTFQVDLGDRLGCDVFYGYYEQPSPPWGISPLHDQVLAGAVMMGEGSLVTIGALAWLFLRLAEEGELRQELLERGLDPRAVHRAVRYGRGQELSKSR